MIPRLASARLQKLALSFPAVVLMGPRQSGKSTLSKALFSEKPYVSLENLDQRSFAQADPRGFLNNYPNGAIIDEVQRVPDLLPYLQGVLDASREMGRFILTGSAQLSLLASVTQSLAGRTGIVNLLPLSLEELQNSNQAPSSLDMQLQQGAYPAIYDRNVASYDWCQNYIQTYLERDVRQILNVEDLGTFQRFMKLCAGRVGQILDLTGLGNDCGISHTTASKWINVLEATFVVFRLQPHFKNFSKRLIKSPKLYFYDTGILSALLGISKPEQMTMNSNRGGIFESWMISEFYKKIYATGSPAQLYYWRDRSGTEVDLLVEQGDSLIPIEIKSGGTIASDWFDNLEKWSRYAGKLGGHPHLIYGGEIEQARSSTEVVSWKSTNRWGKLVDAG